MPRSDDNHQLCFDFMRTASKQLSPKAEYRAYLRSIRDQKPEGEKGESDVTQTERQKVIHSGRKV
jgi:hypothetical protein